MPKPKVVMHTPAEIRSMREEMGLSTAEMAELIGVGWRSAMSWETGESAISRVNAARLAALTRDTDDEVTRLRVAILRGETPALTYDGEDALAVYRTDDAFREAHPDKARWTARWWRRVVARAAGEAGWRGRLVYADDLPANHRGVVAGL